MQKSCSPSSMNGLRTAVRLGRTSANTAPVRRHISDVTITRTGKPIIRTQGGRSSLGGKLKAQRPTSGPPADQVY
ncbi:hypothetical protein WAI453_006607 [Rhynchosporium graminicola]